MEKKEASLRLEVLYALEGAVWYLYDFKYAKSVLTEFIFGKIAGYFFKSRKDGSMAAMQVTEYL